MEWGYNGFLPGILGFSVLVVNHSAQNSCIHANGAAFIITATLFVGRGQARILVVGISFSTRLRLNLLLVR